MRRYLDTSLLVAVLIHEAGTTAAKTYLASCGDRPLVISRWVIAEFSSALAIKVRTGAITASEQAAALMMFRRFRERRLRVLNVEAGDFDAAAGMSDQSGIPLRAGDALHLAVCVRVAARLATFDGGLATAAQHHGVATDYLTAPQTS
jgi:predicted nucleic acid-binding protein